MHLILIPGLWLDASSWDLVVPPLREAGHRTHALTLPGMEGPAADRTGVTLRDHVDAVVGVIDSLDPGEGRPVLVGHSGGGAIAHAAVDARPDRVARVVYVASEPKGEGQCINDQLPVVNGEVPLPEWSFFGSEELDGLDSGMRADFRARAVPAPVGVVRDGQRLSDERRYEVPATVVACEYPSAMLRQWVAQGHPGARELGRIRDVEYVDLATGHWPQFSRPAELARVILASVDGG
ncbi:alpha/beta hydrolase [Streptomyces sp. NPDC005438]|uniref:alpha/beta fold hydrolase n=1 Tax=Streptomyces sp. NPDC005438 TaxID=3156880 RepID=UPI0033A49BE4